MAWGSESQVGVLNSLLDQEKKSICAHAPEIEQAEAAKLVHSQTMATWQLQWDKGKRMVDMVFLKISGTMALPQPRGGELNNFYLTQFQTGQGYFSLNL